MKSERHRILVVDDDIDEQFFAKRALQKALNGKSTVNVVSSGNEAIAYMIGEGKFSDRKTYPFPSLIILDLNMDDGDGFDVLEFMQVNPGWNVVPKILFSSSDDDDDVRTAYFLGASVYHLKPMGADELEERMREIVKYWSSAQVPPVDESGRTLATDSRGRKGARYTQPKAGLTMRRPEEKAVPGNGAKKNRDEKKGS